MEGGEVQRFERRPFVREKHEKHCNFLSDEGPTLEMLDFAFHIGTTLTFFYISICIVLAKENQ